MIRATKNEKGMVIDILTRSFLNNKSVNYLIPQDGMRLFRIHRMMDYSFEVCMLFGKVFISEDRKACALLLYPDLKKNNFRSIALDLKLIFNSIGIRNVLKAMNRESKIKAKQPNERMSYLWFIGVDPKYQKFGLGKRLLEEVIIHCTAENRPIYLETSTFENLPWYKKFGFEVYDTLNISYWLYFLKRPMY
ncbi:MAG TPA: GNAT family N-acetyltransferase [Pedobacter sp.]|uniref:GNAT family N-acetyltransferase n=1 Tax=Pedobacter sp. TaxID=1411316 RepID=UPI002B7F841C|nr:GNAT family N-acetyltransferase [Pedobacter sp.]HMI01270.1 GNAT family N-acetyltransferase [Pedobacter sp.]